MTKKWYEKLFFQDIGNADAAAVSEPVTTIFPPQEQPAELTPPRQHQGKYQNLQKMQDLGLWRTLGLIRRFILEKKVNTVPESPLPLVQTRVENLPPVQPGDLELTRLGHSSILLRNESSTWLIDPVFSQRASPLQWLGPKRFHPVPLDYQNLDKIEGIIISHDHYDHLDKGSILSLHSRVKFFAVPLGVGARLRAWGVAPSKIHEMSWWQQQTLGSLTLTAAPGQHFSGRGLRDRNKTLWAGWAIRSGQNNIYYTGDTGYFETFKIIGQRLGPFDLALVETGAYDKDWPGVHMSPQQSYQAFKDLQAKILFPIHNGTFDLAFHQWSDPLEQITALARQDHAPLATPKMGESFSLSEQGAELTAYHSRWWHAHLQYERLSAQQGILSGKSISPAQQ
ncbi:MBL fold metallo-hydrolase [Dongshaea marina]|uniref:MBL fold metallo-hydrolase n=1 Tax=Dongshaea marina TaxID=2047966 RepID=UPI000D3E85C7|nr:MBL fold metallo-hydrolase [Dongshaea marina]